MNTLSHRFQRYLLDSQLLPAGSRVLVAVSGGADSTALLHLLHQWASPLSLELHAAHLDHALRAESPEDAAHVRDQCAKLAVPLTEARIDVAALNRTSKGGLEATAREARRSFLRSVAQDKACHWIALAHQRDDQVETFLLRLLRGAGTSGLAGMRSSDPPFVRPLLPFWRTELVGWLLQEKISWREDASNLDLTIARNRVRHELLPLLMSYNPAIRERLAELCRQMADDEADWEARVASQMAQAALEMQDEVQLPCAILTAVSPAMAGRLVRAALKQARGHLHRINACHIRAVLALAAGEHPQGELHLPGAWVARRYENLRIRKEPLRAIPLEPFTVDGPGDYPLPDGRTLSVALTAGPGQCGVNAVEFCAHAISFPLQVRSPHPGDRLSLSGINGTRKIQDLFVDSKVTLERRRAAVLVFSADNLLWIAGFRRCAGWHPESGANPVLRLELDESLASPAQSA